MTTIEICFPADLPTGLQKALNEEYPPEKDKLISRKMPVRAFLKECPRMGQWMAANGYIDFDMVLTIGSVKDTE